MENVGTASSSRWNPTKDQITLLENLYKEGIRTPSADQIEEITGRLRAYGHIEGKNVFYWFQNCKARQRQKQKQERIAYFNRLHKTSRFFYPPTSLNVGCVSTNQHGSQVYVSDHLLHRNKVVIPGGGYDKPTITDHEKQLSDITTTRVSMSPNSLRFGHRDHCTHVGEGIHVKSNAQRTLPLFPLQPLAATNDNGVGNSSIAPGSGNDYPVACFGDDGGRREQPFIDFFSGGSTRLDSNETAV